MTEEKVVPSPEEETTTNDYEERIDAGITGVMDNDDDTEDDD
jgi:hypothetical protein